MPTNQEEKPVKPRSRNRKTDQRNRKAEAKAERAPDPVKFEPEPVRATAATEETPVEPAPAEVIFEAAPGEFLAEAAAQAEAAPVISAAGRIESAPVVAAMEKPEEKAKQDTALSGEVLPPEGRRSATAPVGLPAIALAYGEYSRKSWATGRFLVERLIAMRSFDEAIEIQGEFARQVYSNFVVQSEKLCRLYGEWAVGSFRPYEKLAREWTRVGR